MTKISQLLHHRYKATAKLRGADANIGPKLSAMICSAGYRERSAATITPAFTAGDGKQMALITMTAIADAVIHNNLATRKDVDDILRDLTIFSVNPATMSIPTLYQLSCGL